MAISGCLGIFTHNEVLAIYNHWSQLFWHHWLYNDNTKSLVSSKTTAPQHSCFGVNVPNSIKILGSVGFFIGGQQFSLTFPLEPPLIWGTVIHLGLHLFLTKDSICMIPHILVSLITKLLNISRDRNQYDCLLSVYMPISFFSKAEDWVRISSTQKGDWVFLAASNIKFEPVMKPTLQNYKVYSISLTLPSLTFYGPPPSHARFCNTRISRWQPTRLFRVPSL